MIDIMQLYKLTMDLNVIGQKRHMVYLRLVRVKSVWG